MNNTAPPVGMSPTVSVIIVSFNTRDVLRGCLERVRDEGRALPLQVIVVDNASHDGSAAMVARDFPQYELIASDVNLGFAAANNAGFLRASGDYVVLLNPDAFLTGDTLGRALRHMQAAPQVGLAGGLLRDLRGQAQPSGRLFPSPLNDLLTLSGLAARFPRSRFFGRFDRTWADPAEAARVDWVPGAFAIIRRAALQAAGPFDERFFLYYEEVDLCRRIAAAGYEVWYWPDVVVDHIGGECSKTLSDMDFSSSGSQLTLWRLRAGLLYFRKHHGWLTAWAVNRLELWWHCLRAWKNAGRPARRADSERQARVVRQAWNDTRGGAESPARPW